MKILNTIHAQGIGGVDQVFRNYTEVLTQNGNEVALLISKNGHENYQAKKIFRLKNSSQVFDFFHLLLIAFRFRPDLIICHSNRVMKWMRILRFFSSAKSVAVNHGVTFKNSLHCDFVISINQQIADLVVAAGFDETKSFVLQNVIKVDQKFSEKKLKSPPVIGIYGRLEPRKGFDILLKACGILQKNSRDFRLKIGGFEVPGSYGWHNVEELAQEQNISEKCELVGTVLDKKKFFEDVDIFCVPSREEPFGLVILEGFLFSTLVISSDSDGGKLLIKNEENGLLFANENYEDLATKIIKILDNREIYSKLTEQAFLRLEKEFSFDFLGKEFTKILEKISK
ncbi:MAG: glycosyltransferase family 4 protein [Proteobacteria bacterium]|nr:glycosyltransferase family 4 protein [Pseudomonadota bacterium]